MCQRHLERNAESLERNEEHAAVRLSTAAARDVAVRDIEPDRHVAGPSAISGDCPAGRPHASVREASLVPPCVGVGIRSHEEVLCAVE
jgi:hypothetical protein